MVFQLLHQEDLTNKSKFYQSHFDQSFFDQWPFDQYSFGPDDLSAKFSFVKFTSADQSIPLAALEGFDR